MSSSSGSETAIRILGVAADADARIAVIVIVPIGAAAFHRQLFDSSQERVDPPIEFIRVHGITC